MTNTAKFHEELFASLSHLISDKIMDVIFKQLCFFTSGVLWNGDLFEDNLMTTNEASTGVASCLVDEAGSSAIIIVSAANMLLTPEDVQAAEPMISQSKVIICQLEISEETTIAALKLAKKHGGSFYFFYGSLCDQGARLDIIYLYACSRQT